MSSNIRNQMIQEHSDCDPVKCGCQIIGDFKCVDNTCMNRVSGVECSLDCGPNCINTALARIVTDAVEIVKVPFGGYGLQAVRTILKVPIKYLSLP